MTDQRPEGEMTTGLEARGTVAAGAARPAATDEAQRERRRRIAQLKQELVGGDLFSAAEVAEILDIHPRTVGEYIRDGKLKALHLGGGWKVSESALRSFVRDQTQDEVQQKYLEERSPVDVPPAKSGGRVVYKCSFCSKPQMEVERLIAGPNHVYICNECVNLCNEIIAKGRGAAAG